MSALYPMLIKPRYDERIWGGHNLARLLGKDAPANEKIGESWEVYDQNSVCNGAYAGRTIEDLRADMKRELTGHVDPSAVFPMLTKLLDAQDVLSVQVHPDDAEAKRLEHEPYGKTECWYVIHAEPGAEIIYGFSRDTDEREYQERLENGTLNEILRSIRVHEHDVVYLPARTLHAIGAGIVVYELQQT
ncbi:MAG: type I phosphomannose isomerase catalytic subunit, partial [Chloroflexota bacterium]